MVQLQKDVKTIEATGTQIVGINYDPVAELIAFATSKSITFPLLSDEGSKTIKAYGIDNKDGYPHPGTYLIDQKALCARHCSWNAIRIDTPPQILLKRRRR